MNLDANMLMSLMSAMGRGGENGGAGSMQTVLPLMISLMSGAQKNGAADGTGQNGGQGADFMKMLPLLMSLMNGSGKTAAANAGSTAGSKTDGPPTEATEQRKGDCSSYGGGNSPYGRDSRYGNTYDAYGQYDGRTYAAQAPDCGNAPFGSRYGDYGRSDAAAQNFNRGFAAVPFGDIGFAGSEVRFFMEKLWRLRRRF